MTDRTVRTGIRGSLSPLRLADLRLFFAGQAVSLVGTWMQATAVSWLVWQLTHSAAALGTVAMFTFLPFLLLVPVAGAWADRWDRRKLLIRLHLGSAAVALVLALLVSTDQIRIWQLYVTATLLGVTAALEMVSRPSFIGDLAGPELLRRAIGLNSALTQASRMLGPALAGAVITGLGIAAAFWLNAASFLVVIVSLLLIRGNGPTDSDQRSTAHGFGEAIRFLRMTAGLREMIAISALVTLFGMSVGHVLPVVADQVLGGQAATLGWLLSASGAGALLGTLVLVPLAHDVERVGLLAYGAATWVGLCQLILSMSTWLPLSLGCLFLSGLAFPVVITTVVASCSYSAPSRCDPACRARS